MKARILRGIVLAAFGVGLAALVLALLPGVEIFAERSDGNRVAWRPVGTRSAAEHPLGMLVWGVAVLAPGALVWFRPRLTYACLWSMCALVATTMWFVVTTDPVPTRHGSQWLRVVELWPATWWGYTIVLLIGGLVVALPVFCGAFAFVTGRRDGVRPQLPAARVLRRR
ncbi:MAG: hypothetical protein KIT31_03475 [Deltaproteobacteria bacterium]|nr:hypothetical protein [Deltaproteobacteria bacterium]